VRRVRETQSDEPRWRGLFSERQLQKVCRACGGLLSLYAGPVKLKAIS
jgi:hypothetical protein